MRKLLSLFVAMAALLGMLLPMALPVGAIPPGTDTTADKTVDIDLKFPGSDKYPYKGGIYPSVDGYVDPDDFAGRDVNVCGAGAAGGVQVPGGQLFARFALGPNAGSTLTIRFQGFAGQDRMDFVQVVSKPSGATVTVNGADITVTPVAPGDIVVVEFLNKRGHNVITAASTGSGGTGNEAEVNTVGICPRPGGPSIPPPCPKGSLSKEVAAITLGTDYTKFFRPVDLSGPGKGVFDDLTTFPAGSRLTVQFPGRNPLVYVRPGEQVAYQIFSGGISSTDNPRMILRDQYQITRQQVNNPAVGQPSDSIIAADGTRAIFLGKGNVLPKLSAINGFSYFDKNGELYIYDIPSDGLGGYQAIWVVTQIKGNASGYITNKASVLGKIFQPKYGGLVIANIPGICNDEAETAIFRGNSVVLNGASPVDNVPGSAL